MEAVKHLRETFDETWGINCIGGIIEVDKTIMMDPVSRFLDTEDAGSQTGIAKEFLAKNKLAEGVAQLESGLQYKTIKKSEGAKPKNGNQVKA